MQLLEGPYHFIIGNLLTTQSVGLVGRLVEMTDNKARGPRRRTFIILAACYS